MHPFLYFLAAPMSSWTNRLNLWKGHEVKVFQPSEDTNTHTTSGHNVEMKTDADNQQSAQY